MTSEDNFLTVGRFPWDSLGAIIGGRSAIDVGRLRVANLNEAAQFLSVYGFDWSREGHRAEVEALRTDALRFIDEELLPDVPDIAINSSVREQTDVRHLLVWASATERDDRQRWSCSVLRVMHTFAHAQSYFENRFGAQLREQILSRFAPHVHETEDGLMLGQGELAIPLSGFEVKPGKPLHSVVIKLLHKVENVASPVFDHVGVRFITKERFDALLVVRYLRKNSVIMFANVMPSRSRNTLIDLERVRQHLQAVDELCERGDMGDHQRWQAMRDATRDDPYPPGELSYNSHTSISYRSIQFTCRQYVRVANPLANDVYAVLDKLGECDGERSPEVLALAERAQQDAEMNFFFPYEVQVLDQRSYEESRHGLAAHSEYKRRQRDTVRKRVLGDLLYR
jgi:uncharacterized protein (TIGR04562 family)